VEIGKRQRKWTDGEAEEKKERRREMRKRERDHLVFLFFILI